MFIMDCKVNSVDKSSIIMTISDPSDIILVFSKRCDECKRIVTHPLIFYLIDTAQFAF